MAAIVRGYVSCRFRPPTKAAEGWWFLAPPGLSGFGDFVRLEAAGADEDALLGAVFEDADLLEVRVEAAPGGDHRVASGVAEAGTLTAVVTYACHGTEHPSRSGRFAASSLNRGRKAA